MSKNFNNNVRLDTESMRECCKFIETSSDLDYTLFSTWTSDDVRNPIRNGVFIYSYLFTCMLEAYINTKNCHTYAYYIFI